MRRFNRHAIGIDQGDVVLFSDFEAGGAMWDGEGRREARAYVHFTEPFAGVPAVLVSLSMWDISNGANARADVKAEDVGPEGFAVVFRTWGDTRVARVRVGWTAMGPVADDDQWEVE